jgi:hypothetical protein
MTVTNGGFIPALIITQDKPAPLKTLQQQPPKIYIQIIIKLFLIFRKYWFKPIGKLFNPLAKDRIHRIFDTIEYIINPQKTNTQHRLDKKVKNKPAPTRRNILSSTKIKTIASTHNNSIAPKYTTSSQNYNVCNMSVEFSKRYCNCFNKPHF